MFHYSDFSANSLLFSAVNCRVVLSCKYRAVTESVEIVISGDHEGQVIGICGYTLIAVIICRHCFFFNLFILLSVLLQLSDKITVTEEGELLCNGEGEDRVARFKSRGRMSGDSKSKDEYLFPEAQKLILPAKQRMSHDEDKNSVSCVPCVGTALDIPHFNV